MTEHGEAGSQAGQPTSGSQAGQNTGESQQGEAQGSQAGQSQQAYFNEAYMKQGETVEQAFQRMSGALETARKQAAGYRNRLNGENGSGSQEGQGQQGQSGGQQGNDEVSQRIARLEQALAAERQANAANRTRTQLIEALASEGAVNPTRAVRLVDLDTLEIGDDGTVVDPLGAIRSLKADMPQIFTDTQGNGDGGSGNNSGNPQTFNDLIRSRGQR